MSYSPSQNGWNIACHASAQDDCAVMEWLLDHMKNYGADITSQDKVGGTVCCITIIITSHRKDSLPY